MVANALPASDSPADKIALSKTLVLAASIPSFIQLLVGPEEPDRLNHELYAQEDKLGMRLVGDYKNAIQVQKYTDTTSVMFQIILGDEDVATGAQALTLQDINQKDPTKNYNPQTVEELNALIPSIGWSLLVQESLPARLNASHPLIGPSPSYLTKLDKLPLKTPIKSLQHYFSWILIRNLAEHLSETYKEPLVAFKDVASTVPPAPMGHLWTCIKAVNTNLVHITTHYFVQASFKNQNRKDVVAIIDNIIASYKKYFSALQWLDQQTRDGAI
ncbi:hypothetical protein BG015_006835 [Linnemannia schmuckeri]|uniref:Peptidase M13 N-terminal domain-containing protein n=1 Tax=Linnemannia schmuckeri TaxID=64567 RepID=A0A9P5VBU9_9FUNG|nr:hypothetical protein BG015_006835 [Linnemannia schmuckeri]